MRAKSFHHAVPRFLALRLHGRKPHHMLESVSPDPVAERGKGVIENILRWEDDGGLVFETGHPILSQAAETNTPRLQD